MTLSDLDEIRFVSSPGGHMQLEGILPSQLVWLPRNGSLNFQLFCRFCCICDIEAPITLPFSTVLQNKLHHLKGSRMSFHVVCCMASFDEVAD